MFEEARMDHLLMWKAQVLMRKAHLHLMSGKMLKAQTAHLMSGWMCATDGLILVRVQVNQSQRVVIVLDPMALPHIC